MNVLWIIADQLRWDYLSCFGATHINTPNIDRLAKRSVRFNKAYVQSPVCGPSRMSFYTGRYVRSHGATWNGFPLRVGEPTLGDHLREIGVRCSLVGKTHMTPDREGMERLGISPESTIGALVSECGFDVVVRDDGTNHTDYPGRCAEDYEAYLKEHGMEGDNAWEEWANTGVTPEGEFRSGWLLENAKLPARVPQEHSETAWLTTRGIEYIDAQNDQPWLCHLSYIKPHWPYLAPAPYNDMYSAADLPPVNRSETEKKNPHPLLDAWMDMRVSKSFSRDRGRLFTHLEESGRMDDTMIVFCADHGDNMGDHYIGEKDLFYDCSARVPFIVYDPRKAADATRGTVIDKLVEGIDLAPTFVDFFGGKDKPHIFEGRSLQALLHSQPGDWRHYCVSEYDYSTRDARRTLDIDERDARLVMIFDGHWKYVHVENMRAMLFDLVSDPMELNDLGNDPRFEEQLKRLAAMHFAWTRQHHSRITKNPEAVNLMTDAKEPPGIFIGYANVQELEADGLSLPPHTKT